MIRLPSAALATTLAGVAAVLALGADPQEPRKPIKELPPFHKELIEVGQIYHLMGRVDDEFFWAPFLCRAQSPGYARFSDSNDAETHGRKLYSLFARDRSAYMHLAKNSQPVGQQIVKEVWLPREVKAGDPPPKAEARGLGAFYPYASRDGRLFKAEKVTGLFIMHKLDSKTPNTDEGWVYATLSADGKEVTAAGRLESCMSCHQKAKHDRLFGLPGWTEDKSEEKPKSSEK
jgi:hypothetical protein